MARVKPWEYGVLGVCVGVTLVIAGSFIYLWIIGADQALVWTNKFHEQAFETAFLTLFGLLGLVILLRRTR